MRLYFRDVPEPFITSAVVCNLKKNYLSDCRKLTSICTLNEKERNYMRLYFPYAPHPFIISAMVYNLKKELFIPLSKAPIHLYAQQEGKELLRAFTYF